MKYKFIKENITAQNLLDLEQDPNNAILLENNIAQIEKILNFFKNDNSVLLTTGFMGTGKTAVVRHCLHALSEETLLLWANCYESTNLDDIFLNFFEQFKHLATHNLIKVPQARFESFSQRINAYFYSIENPITIIINSYQELLPENTSEILNFIEHLSEFPKIKIIIITRNFNQEKLSDKVKQEKINITALSEESFQKYITLHKIRVHGPVFEEFYKLTKGYYFYTTLALKVMTLKGLTPIEFMDAHSKSFLTLKEFLFKENIEMMPPTTMHLLRFLTIIRYPVNMFLLQSLNLYDEMALQAFAINGLIEIEQGHIYLKSYYRNILDVEIPDNIKVKLHRSCMELYEMQLPLKPDERALLISRRTLRQEIEYHKTFLPKQFISKNNVEIINGQVVFVQQEPTQTKDKLQQAPEEKTLYTNEDKETLNIPTKPKRLQDLLFVFEEEEENLLLDNISDSITQFLKDANTAEMVQNNMSTDDILESIQLAQSQYDFRKVITLCEKAITDNSLTETLQAELTEKIATSYAKLTDTFNAQKHFTKACKLYKNLNNYEKQAETEFNIAKMNFAMFKRNEAKEILLNIKTDNNNLLKIKTNLLLFDIYLEERDEEKAFEACKNSMKLLNKSETPEIVCELLFKCGLILEARNNTSKAIEAYEKALKFNEDEKVNPYLQQIYSNLTTLYNESDQMLSAKKYCKKALALSTQKNDFEGLYNANIKLAELYSNENTDESRNFIENAIKYADKLNDKFYKLSALMFYGDILYSKTELIEALLQYLQAYKLAKDNFMDEYLTKINQRILDVKYRVSPEIFNEKAKNYNYEK